MGPLVRRTWTPDVLQPSGTWTVFHPLRGVCTLTRTQKVVKQRNNHQNLTVRTNTVREQKWLDQNGSSVGLKSLVLVCICELALDVGNCRGFGWFVFFCQEKYNENNSTKTRSMQKCSPSPLQEMVQSPPHPRYARANLSLIWKNTCNPP